MPRLSLVDGSPPPDRGSRRASTTSPPLYRQVCDAVEALAMGMPLGDEHPLPPEGQLLARFDVSRGTLRRAVDELVRVGLLRVDPGRGTYVVQATKVRWLVWDRLAEVARPDSRFDLDLSRFVPDFEGREGCDEALLALPAFSAARSVFIAPDNSLEALRTHALDAGKRILVPTFGMRRGFVLLDGARIDPADHHLAATLDGMERYGRNLTLAELRQLDEIGLVVTGAVAVTQRGLHLGGGDGYFDLEWGLLRHCGLATPQTTVAVVVHSCQVLDADIRPVRHDAVADLIITPEGTHTCTPSLPKPDGLFWDELLAGFDQSRPYIRDLLAERPPPALPSRRRPLTTMEPR